MKILSDQIFAGTGVDRHGDAISETELIQLFEQVPDPYVMYADHNPGARPFSRSFNKRLQRLANGNLAIVCDVEVYDEDAMAKYAGYSISFTRNTYTIDETRVPEIHVRFNPRLFRTEDLHRLVEMSEPTLQLNASEIYQKALDIPLLIFITCAAGSVFSGFFSAMGKDLYEATRTSLTTAGRKVREEHGEDLGCQFSFVASHLPRRPQVLVSVSTEMIERLVALNVTDAMIIAELAKHYALSEVARASLVLVDGTPTWRVEYVMDSLDSVPRLGNGDT